MAKSSVSVEAVRELLHRCRDKDGRYRSAYIPQELCFCTVRHCPLWPSIDRVMSVQNNGHRADHSAENVQIVCVFVNRLKGTSDEGDFIDMLQDFAQEPDGRSAPEHSFVPVLQWKRCASPTCASAGQALPAALQGPSSASSSPARGGPAVPHGRGRSRIPVRRAAFDAPPMEVPAFDSPLGGLQEL